MRSSCQGVALPTQRRAACPRAGQAWGGAGETTAARGGCWRGGGGLGVDVPSQSARWTRTCPCSRAAAARRGTPGGPSRRRPSDPLTLCAAGSASSLITPTPEVRGPAVLGPVPGRPVCLPQTGVRAADWPPTTAVRCAGVPLQPLRSAPTPPGFTPAAQRPRVAAGDRGGRGVCSVSGLRCWGAEPILCGCPGVTVTLWGSRVICGFSALWGEVGFPCLVQGQLHCTRLDSNANLRKHFFSSS